MSVLATIAEMRPPGHTIRERRTELGWTQAELAERSDVAQADISQVENGRLDARWSTIQGISEALESSIGASTRRLANAHRARGTPRSTGSTTWEHTIAPDELATTADTLTTSDRPELRALAVPLTGWLTERGLETRPHGLDVATRSAGPELGIEF